MAIKRLFWDIETSPNEVYSWRVGYKIQISHENILKERAIICICYKWEDKKKVHSLTWDNGDDKEMVETFLEVAKQADELVAHNGDRFDLKWFNTRCLKHGLSPIPELKTADTLVIARRRFYFNSNRLDYLGKFLLGQGKIQTDFDLWKDVCRGDEKAMRKMVRYCQADVRLLQRVWGKLQSYHKPKTHTGVLMGRAKWTCSQCGSEDVIKSKTRVTSMGTVQHQMKCKTCGKYYKISDKSHKEYLEAKYVAV